MSTAPSMPASAPGYLLPASAHGLLWDVGEVLRRLATRAAVEQASDDPAQQLLSQPGVLSQALRSLSGGQKGTEVIKRTGRTGPRGDD